MGNTKQYLDYAGLQTYHSELVQRLADLEYDPNRLFADINALTTKSNWERNGRISGVKEGMMVTVGGLIWQLVNVNTFKGILNDNSSVTESTTAEDLGWTIISNTVDFNVDDHILELTK